MSEHQNKIEPCPLCGKSLITIATLKKGNYRLKCFNTFCPSNKIYNTKEEAIKAWNKGAKNE